MRKLSLKGITYPTDLNPGGTAFGGWVMSKMDKAASVVVADIIKSPAVTVTVSRINFLKPIHNGDIFSIYTEITAIGTTSITIYVSVEIKNLDTNKEYEVTSAEFKFVAIDTHGKPVNVRSVLRDEIDKDIKPLL
ncbi:MAG: hotdog domain-containing protein [Sulfurovum sp.]|uniref:acyl-CoA thioesterase n=1 Tax=Sulfurovum sp. TaxID=1969726 RepID=UPI003C792782